MKRRQTKYLSICVFMLCYALKTHAQFSKTHYIPPLTYRADVSGISTPQDQYLYISTPSDSAVNFKIIEIGGTTINASATRTTPYIHDIGNSNDSQLFTPENNTYKVLNNKGYRIVADDLIYVTVKMNTGNGLQAGALISKGLAGIGKTFRAGTFNNPSFPTASLNFISIMATENNTSVTISDIDPGTSYINGNSDADVTISLNTGETYILATKVENTNAANNDGLLGALIESNKDIAVNCGSTSGSSAESTASQRDYGVDQIAPVEKIGTDYIFTRGYGTNEMENAIIIAHEDNTNVYVNGIFTPYATINAGEYVSIEGNQYNGGNKGANMYVRADKAVYAYQAVGGTDKPANVGLFFVPPLNCETPNIVNNIPHIGKIGSKTFTGGITILAQLNAQILINDTPIASLGGTYTITGPSAVTGNTGFVTYMIEGLTGNVSISSDSQVYVAAFGSNNAATFGGYYSGFSYRPEVHFQAGIDADKFCLPNVTLGMSTITSYDAFQWFKDGNEIPGETGHTFKPSTPGYYKVEGAIYCSNKKLRSDVIPVSHCPNDYDEDGIPDNIDLDIDNDGIANCSESLGNDPFLLQVPSSGNFIDGTNFTGSIQTVNTASPTPFEGADDGRFTLSVPKGITNIVQYKTVFDQPLNVKLSYAETELSNDSQLTNKASFRVIVPVDHTVTIDNRDNQLLIDTNYDGVYESGIATHSSFDVRFILNSNSLNFGEGTFAIKAHQTSSFEIICTNGLDSEDTKVTLQLTAFCIGKDSDGDTISDSFDLDSDNDGIPDLQENLGTTYTSIDLTDANKDGILDVFSASASNQTDTDTDGLYDYIDLDSDNDGIYDLIEFNANQADQNNDGRIDGTLTQFGYNGLFDAIETTVDNGIINYVMGDFDGDQLLNSVELDADNDACYDVTEAGFMDQNFDGVLGNTTVTTDNNGIVTSEISGYTLPNNNYRISAPITITNQTTSFEICELETTTLNIDSPTTNLKWQWQISTDGIEWKEVQDDSMYSGAKSSQLGIVKIASLYTKLYLRAVLSKTGNSCGLISDEIQITINPLPSLRSTSVEICPGDSVDLTTLENPAPTISYRYFATRTNAEAGTPELSTTNVAPEITTSYFVNALENDPTKSTSCETVIEVTVQVNPVQNLNITKPQICIGESIDLTTLISSTNTAFSYYNSEADALNDTAALPSTLVSPNTSTIYFVKALDTDTATSTSCYAVSEIYVQVNPLPNLLVTDTEICLGESIDLSTVIEHSETSTIRYYPSHAAAVAGTPELPSKLVNPTENTSYYIKATDNSEATTTECRNIQELKIQVNPLPTATIHEGEICFGDNIDINLLIESTPSTRHEYYLSLPDAAASTSPLESTLLSPTFDTTYFVKTYDTNTATTTSCSIINEIKVRVNQLPVVQIPTKEICFDEEFDLNSLINTAFDIRFFSHYSDAQFDTFELTSSLVRLTNTRKYYARITDLETLCFQVQEFTIVVNQPPNLSVNKTSICLGDTVNLQGLVSSDADTFLTFFPSRADAENSTNSLSSNSVEPNPLSRYFVKSTSSTTNCHTIKEIDITILPIPELNEVTLVQCDDDTDGYSQFNLLEKENEITPDFAAYDISYYLSYEGAEILDPTALIQNPNQYINKTPSSDIVWVRVMNTTSCINIIPFRLEVTRSLIDDSFIRIYSSCDDFLDKDGNSNSNNNDMDGISSFDFSSVEADIRALLPTSQSYSISYYETQEDALEEVNKITNSSNFRNSNSPESQSIWVRIDSDLNDDCYGFGPYVLLTVDPLPEVQKVAPLELCDDNADGFTSGFDLNSQTRALLGTKNPADYTVSYHRSLANAKSGIHSLQSPFTNEIAEQQTIYVRIQDKKTGCINPYRTFEIIVNAIPPIETISDMIRCDDDLHDGIVSDFELNLKKEEIIRKLPSSNFVVSFYRTAIEAQQGSNEIVGNYFQNDIANSQKIFVRVESTQLGCVNAMESFNLIVQQSPEFTVTPSQLVCTDNPQGLDISAENPKDSYRYEWRSAKGQLLGINNTLAVYRGGEYTVTAFTLPSGSCSLSKTITVTESNAASFTDINIIDGNELNSIIVAAGGDGDYEYQLDDNGFSEDNKFYEVSPGVHTVTINDKKGCGTSFKKEITVLNIPKFITPNQDAQDDYWFVDLGPLRASVYQKAEIKIFDRHGKMLKRINPLSTNSHENCWDGRINGQVLPRTDYWYSIELINSYGELTFKTGHFSLIK